LPYFLRILAPQQSGYFLIKSQNLFYYFLVKILGIIPSKTKNDSYRANQEVGANFSPHGRRPALQETPQLSHERIIAGKSWIIFLDKKIL
jgi:hypothetical protein